MTKAIVNVFAVEILCPTCQQEIPSPNGSLFWSTDEVDLLAEPNKVTCPACGVSLKVKMPKDVE